MASALKWRWEYNSCDERQENLDLFYVELFLCSEEKWEELFIARRYSPRNALLSRQLRY